MSLLIGMDIGGTNLRLGVISHADHKVKLVEEMRFQADFSSFCKTHAPAQAWQMILQTIMSAIASVRQKYPEVVAVGIGFPGFIDPVTEMISQSPNLPGLHNVDLSTDLAALIRLPVITENDALAAAYGEYLLQVSVHTQHSSRDLIYIGLGTGVGGGLILQGMPVPGQHGVAMEVGHIIVSPQGRPCGCGNAGCMEQYASASGVAISYFKATGQHCMALEIALRAKDGDVEALAAYALAGKTLAQALAHILKVIDVTNIIIGGGMSAAWALMRESFEKQIDYDLIPALRGKVRVKLSDLGDHAGMIGAALLAEKKLHSLNS